MCKDVRFFSSKCAFFSCETWTRPGRETNTFPGKVFFNVPAALPPGRGRPSGGLEWSISPSLMPKCISSSSQHIAVHFGAIDVSAIGVYYKPDTDIDDMIYDLRLRRRCTRRLNTFGQRPTQTTPHPPLRVPRRPLPSDRTPVFRRVFSAAEQTIAAQLLRILLLRAGIESNPGPDSNTMESLTILQLNVNGLKGKLIEVVDFMQKHTITVAAIQETKLTARTKLPLTPGYTLVRADRGRNKGGGLAYLIHDSVPFREYKLTQPPGQEIHLECLAIAIKTKEEEMILTNVYIPPTSSCEAGYVPTIQHLIPAGKLSLLMGDINAHHTLWASSHPEDTRGRIIAAEVEVSDMTVLNTDTPTFQTPRNSSSPDISLVSASLALSTSWNTCPALGSDHVPILISLDLVPDKISAGNRTFINFKKANWEGFTKSTEEAFDNLPQPSCPEKAEQIFRKKLLKAAKQYIPVGRIPLVRPSFPTEAAQLAEIRDGLKRNDPTSPRITPLNNEIADLVNKHRRDKWLETIQGHEPGSKGLWSLIKSISNPKTSSKNQPIQFADKLTYNAKKAATKFNKQFTPRPAMKPSKEGRITRRRFRKLKDDAQYVFTCDQTKAAIRKAKSSKALGPDGLSAVHLKHLGPNGVKYLTQIFNNSVKTSTIPQIWRTARIVPIPKPNKPVGEAASYRPISLLSPAVKVLERLMLPTMSMHLEPADHQHGFRQGYSTTTALEAITDHITTGMNQPKPVKRTIAVALDLSKAFDMVNHDLLLRDILESSLPNHVKRWIYSYLRGRQTYVEFRNTTSKHRVVKQGVPQGG
jgi:exonuclease III